MPDSGPPSQDSTDALRDRFRGTLLGLAVGDALGGPLEFQPAPKLSDYITEMTGGGWQRLAPGEWTDDTAMTLCVVESLLTRRVFDPDDIARRLVIWMKSGPKDITLHDQRVLDVIARGGSWEQASRDAHESDPDDALNGSLIRSTPLALFFHRNPEYVASLSRVLSRITHAHPLCEWACVCHNVTITALLSGRNPTQAVEDAFEACGDAPRDLLERIGRAMEPTLEAAAGDSVLDTLEIAIWSLLHGNGFEGAVVLAVNRGGDSDTNGAVTGALAGARYGMSGIPTRWLAALRDAEFLTDYADNMFDLAQGSA